MTKVAPGSLLDKLIEVDVNTETSVGGDASAANQETTNSLLEGIQGQIAQSKTILTKTTLSVDSTTAQALPNVPVDAEGFLIQIEGATVRYFLDGSTPTSSSGHQAAINSTIEERMSSIGNVKFIAEIGTANLTITYFKYAINPAVVTPLPATDNLISMSDGVAIVLPAYPAIKSFQFRLTGTGVLTADVSLQFSNINDDAAYEQYAIATLTDTNPNDSVVVENTFKYARIVVSNLTGTGATVTANVRYA